LQEKFEYDLAHPRTFTPPGNLKYYDIVGAPVCLLHRERSVAALGPNQAAPAGKGERSMLRIPILMYHEISTRPHACYLRFTVTPHQFAQQMKWLANHGYTTVTPADLMSFRAGLKACPKKPLMLTFDDGCRECVEHATTTLPRYGFTGIFYLVSGCMGATTTWTKERLNIALETIDWNTARDLLARGFLCGSHTVTHQRLATLSSAECREELHRSRARLQDALGHDVLDLAYPHGSFNEEVRQAAAAAGYRTAVTTRVGLSTPSNDALALPRIGIYGDESFRDFKFRVRTGKRTDELIPQPVYVLGSRVKRLLNVINPRRHNAAD
jgi:peptidoglycan/xylan/chitin deacetylase (PgdA/CDA1 family)